MAAEWSPNEITAARRRCHLVIYTIGGVYAPRQTDFNGCVYLFRGSSLGELSLGTITNCRRPLVLADDAIEAVNVGAKTMTVTAHAYEHGDGPFIADKGFGDVGAGQDFWIAVIDANTIAVAGSPANAYAGIYETLSGAEVGAVISDKADTTRGLDGDFNFEAAPEDTDADVSEIMVVVEKAGFARARASISPRDGSDGFNAPGEGGNTYGDMHRAMYAALLGKSGDFTTGTYTFKDPTTGTIVRFTITADETGRLVSIPGNLTGP